MLRIDCDISAGEVIRDTLSYISGCNIRNISDEAELPYTSVAIFLYHFETVRMTPLLNWTAENGYAPVVRLLLEKGVRPGDPNVIFVGRPLQRAIMGGHEAVVRLLVENGADLEGPSWETDSPLSLAATEGLEAIVRLLFEKGADSGALKSLRPERALSNAAANVHEAIIRPSLGKGVDIETDGYRYRRKDTALHQAAANGHEAIVRILLENGSNIYALGSNTTPVSLAAENGHETIVQLLLENGAGANAKPFYLPTALENAIVNGHEAIVRLILDKGVETETGENGDTDRMLRTADFSGQEAIVRSLLERGASLEA
jgi:ankyrin repeat protein